MNKIKLLFVLFTISLIFACGEDDHDTTLHTEKPKPKKMATVPHFERDTAYAFIKEQVELGPRVLGTEAHEKAKDIIVARLKQYGWSVEEQKFEAAVYTGDKFPATNIIAKINPAESKRILLSTHWDSRHIADSPWSTKDQDKPILGADDGGSGVGVLLELARQISQTPLKGMGVDLVFFDAEDYGDSREHKTEEEQRAASLTWALGSQYYGRNFSGIKPKFGILLDMVGARNAQFPKEGYSMQGSPYVTNSIWELAGKMGYGNYFQNRQGGGITDDHIYVMKYTGIPMTDIINLPINNEGQTFGSYHHTHNDNMDIIDSRTLRAVGQVLLAVIYKESDGSF